MKRAQQWLRALTGRRAALSPTQAIRWQRLQQFASLSVIAGVGSRWADDAVDHARWVVADVESSGLDVRRDWLIAIGAVAVAGRGVQLADSFEVVLRQQQVSTDANILVHRIAGRDQIEGVDPVDALLGFLEFVGDSPLVGYHAQFDALMIEGACQRYLGSAHPMLWLDLARLAPVLVGASQRKNAQPRASVEARPLDWWLERFHIQILARHNAAADALGTAQLLGVLLPMCKAQGFASVASIVQLLQDDRWLGRR